MNIKRFFPWINEAWHSYQQHRTQLWWPLSFLFLTPLAVLILFGGIIPFGLNTLGWVSFEYKILNYPYMLLVAGLVFFAWFPFLDGTYRLINDCLQGKPINENTGFLNLLNSQDMGKALGSVVLVLVLFQGLSALFKPFTLLFIFAFASTVFTPILTINDNQSPWKKGLESLQLTLQNKLLVAQVWGLRVLLTIIVVLPWIVVACLGGLHTLKMIAGLFAVPAFVYLVIKVFPFYFYYPVFVYEQMNKKAS